MLEILLNLDGNILLWIQENIRNSVLNIFFTHITKLGDMGAIWILLSLILIIFKKTRKVGMVSLASLFFTFLVNNMFLKEYIARIRPYEVITGLQLLIEKQTDFSFPSGHTGSSFASAVVLYKMLPKTYGIPAIILAILITISRLYVGVHYPSDVIVGLIIGTVIAMIVCKLSKYIEYRFSDDEFANL